jgi:hypothetical protein
VLPLWRLAQERAGQGPALGGRVPVLHRRARVTDPVRPLHPAAPPRRRAAARGPPAADSDRSSLPPLLPSSRLAQLEGVDFPPAGNAPADSAAGSNPGSLHAEIVGEGARAAAARARSGASPMARRPRSWRAVGESLDEADESAGTRALPPPPPTPTMSVQIVVSGPRPRPCLPRRGRPSGSRQQSRGAPRARSAASAAPSCARRPSCRAAPRACSAALAKPEGGCVGLEDHGNLKRNPKTLSTAVPEIEIAILTRR